MSFQDSCQINVHLSLLGNQKHSKGLFVLFIYVMARSNYFPSSFSLFHGWQNFYRKGQIIWETILETPHHT